jgi:hypothetical protein
MWPVLGALALAFLVNLSSRGDEPAKQCPAQCPAKCATKSEAPCCYEEGKKPASKCCLENMILKLVESGKVCDPTCCTDDSCEDCLICNPAACAKGLPSGAFVCVGATPVPLPAPLTFHAIRRCMPSCDSTCADEDAEQYVIETKVRGQDGGYSKVNDLMCPRVTVCENQEASICIDRNVACQKASGLEGANHELRLLVKEAAGDGALLQVDYATVDITTSNGELATHTNSYKSQARVKFGKPVILSLREKGSPNNHWMEVVVRKASDVACNECVPPRQVTAPRDVACVPAKAGGYYNAPPCTAALTCATPVKGVHDFHIQSQVYARSPEGFLYVCMAPRVVVADGQSATICVDPAQDLPASARVDPQAFANQAHKIGFVVKQIDKPNHCMLKLNYAGSAAVPAAFVAQRAIPYGCPVRVELPLPEHMGKRSVQVVVTKIEGCEPVAPPMPVARCAPYCIPPAPAAACAPCGVTGANWVANPAMPTVAVSPPIACPPCAVAGMPMRGVSYVHAPSPVAAPAMIPPAPHAAPVTKFRAIAKDGEAYLEIDCGCRLRMKCPELSMDVPGLGQIDLKAEDGVVSIANDGLTATAKHVDLSGTHLRLDGNVRLTQRRQGEEDRCLTADRAIVSLGDGRVHCELCASKRD